MLDNKNKFKNMLWKKKESLEQVQQKAEKKPINKQKVFDIAACSLLVVTHIAIILAIILSFRYYAIYPSLFGSIVAIIICILIITDIIFFVGFNHKDLALKVVSCVLIGCMLLGGTVGTYFVAKANGIVNNILSNGKTDRYETFSGVFVYYGKSENEFKQLSDLNQKRVGVLSEKTNGLKYIATNLLDKEKIDYACVEFATNNELITALIDNDVDAIVITSAYRDIYSKERDENSPFAQYLDYFVDFNSFEQELKVTSTKPTKNLSKDPFNVLLIGYSRTDIGSTVGLADSIIVATINPQTYTVSMMSIARDSFVPIPCYGGEYDKINSGRSTSRACFIDTVENFLNMDIDYYMELDYLGLVQIVNTLGGITINNPVEFELDGIYVPAGENVFADGQMALQFCRERHHMPNGDFDRQQHQKEVIIEIAKKLVQSADITLALNCMNAASDWMSTDFTLSELTSIFNLLLNTKNRTGLNTFDLIDFQTLRMTGNGGLKYYSYSMHLPLWVYLIYQGSYDESVTHINEIMGNYPVINQDKNFEYSCITPYERPLFYSLEYDEKYMFTPDSMPAYWSDLTGLTLSEAMAWASANGVKLSVGEVIPATDSRYVLELEGKISDQSVRYGSLISENASGTVTVMGASDIDLDDYYVPDFIGSDVSKVISWANKHDITVTGNEGITSGRVVKDQSPAAGTPIKDVEKIKVTLKAPEQYTVTFDGNGGTFSATSKTVTQGSTYGDLPTVETAPEGKRFDGWYTSDGKKVTSDTDVTITTNITLKAKWVDIVMANYAYYDEDGSTAITGCSGTFEKGGTVPACTVKPTKASDSTNTYAFKEWTITIDPTTGNATCVAVYTATPIGGGSTEGGGTGGEGTGGEGSGGEGTGTGGEGTGGEGSGGEGTGGEGSGGEGTGGEGTGGTGGEGTGGTGGEGSGETGGEGTGGEGSGGEGTGGSSE